MRPVATLNLIWLSGLLSLSAPSAMADDYGCTVLLCLSNPNGPKAVSECVSPIDRLYNDLRKGRPFPHCDLASTSDHKSAAVTGRNYFDDCPAGTSALPAGEFALNVQSNQIYQGIGSGSDGYGGGSQKICVAQPAGQTTMGIPATDGSSDVQTVPVAIYRQIVTLNPAGTPNYIDVMIDGKRYTRVRY